MAPASVTAHFPLGVYHGHAADGSPEPFPSPARLFSAFVSASHTGVTAGTDGQVAPDIDEALTWLEKHPPHGLHIPSTAPVQSGKRVAYRKTGGLMHLLRSSIPAYCSLCVTFQARLAPSRAAGRAASRRSTSSGPVSRPREQRSVERAGPS